MDHKEPVETEIPWSLHIQLIKLQALHESSYEEACKTAAKLIDQNGPEFQQAVQKEARRLENSSLMTKVNKSRKAWMSKGYEKGFGEGRKKGFNEAEKKYRISYPCSVCQQPLIMLPGSADHTAMQKLMVQSGWSHKSCIDKS